MTERTFAIRIGSAPDATDSSEMLELVLAGASLEIDLVVVFEGQGAGHLRQPAARPWRQLVDFGLAELWLLGGPAGLRVDLPVSRVAPDQFEQRLGNRLVITL